MAINRYIISIKRFKICNNVFEVTVQEANDVLGCTAEVGFDISNDDSVEHRGEYGSNRVDQPVGQNVASETHAQPSGTIVLYKLVFCCKYDGKYVQKNLESKQHSIYFQ